MPAKSEILATLSRVANEGILVSIGWHLVVAGATALILFGVRPGQRTLAVGLTAPLASVSVVSFYYGNPFNGAVFSASSIVLLVLALRSGREELRLDQSVFGYLGYGLVLFGWVYPHFLVEQPWLAYAYAAPLGTLPCPTLALVLGVALAGRGMVGGAWVGTLVTLGLFYAVFGVVRLGVYLDLVLLLGPVGLLAQSWIRRSASRVGGAHQGPRKYVEAQRS